MSRVVLCSQNLTVPEDPRVWREARTLAGAGHAVSVISPGASGRARREVLEGVEILRYPTLPVPDGLLGQALETANALWWTVLYALWLTVSGSRIDVLHAANPPDTFFLAALVLRPFGTRFVFDQHDACPELLLARSGARRIQDRLLRLLEAASYRTAHAVIAPNNSYRRLAIDRGGVDEDAVVVVRSGPEEVRAVAPATGAPDETSDGREDDRLVVAFAGVMGPQDGVEVLVDAAAIVLARHPDALTVDLIGAGTAVDGLRRQADAAGIGAAVRFPGWLRGDAFLQRLGEATVAVSPDGDDAFTRVSTMTKVGDYLGLGIPAVVADLPENRVTAGDAALYFTPGDAGALAAALERLISEPHLRTELRQRALARAPALTWEHGARRLVTAYEWLLEGGPPVPGEQVPIVEEAGKTPT